MSDEGLDWPPPTIIHAEGARVGFTTCPKCGAVVMLDPRDTVDAIELHEGWHREQQPLMQLEKCAKCGHLPIDGVCLCTALKGMK